MPEKLETHTQWDDADKQLHREKQLPATEAKQGHTGRRVLTVLLVALFLAVVVWVMADVIGGGRQGTPQASAPVPAPSQTEGTTAAPKPTTTPSTQPQ